MELRHTKHHQAYVKGLKPAEDAYFKAPSMRDLIALQAALKLNGAGRPSRPVAFCVVAFFIVVTGHINHALLELGRTSHLSRRAEGW